METQSITRRVKSRFRSTAVKLGFRKDQIDYVRIWGSVEQWITLYKYPANKIWDRNYQTRTDIVAFGVDLHLFCPDFADLCHLPDRISHVGYAQYRSPIPHPAGPVGEELPGQYCLYVDVDPEPNIQRIIYDLETELRRVEWVSSVDALCKLLLTSKRSSQPSLYWNMWAICVKAGLIDPAKDSVEEFVENWADLDHPVYAAYARLEKLDSQIG